MTKKEISYSEAIEELEGIITDIENENISVDDLTDKVKRAAALIKTCKKALQMTEEEVKKILKDIEE